jgi:hypothetical protein
MTKMKTIGVMLMAFSSHRQKIAAARRPSRIPSNGLEMANQKETSQPESWAIAFVFMLFSQAFEDRHFRKRENYLGVLRAQHTTRLFGDVRAFLRLQ